MTPEEAYLKAWRAGKRLPELESIVLTSPENSCCYAIGIIKSRWVEAEDLIITDSNLSLVYARYAIKDKLPEKMHNMMILYAIRNPNDDCVKDYFEWVNT